MRKDFTQALSGLLAGVEHVFLNCELWPCRSFAENKHIEILLRKRDLSQTVAALKASSLFQQVVILTSKYRTSTVIGNLENGPPVRFEFWHKLSFDSLNFLNEEALFASCINDRDGIKMPSIEHHFEYVVLKNFLMRQGITDKQYRYFNDFHVLIQEDLLEFFNQKYGTSFYNLYQLTEFTLIHREAIGKRLKQAPMNQFIQSINLRWAKILGSSIAPGSKHHI